MRDHSSLLAWQRAYAVTLGAFRLAADHWRPAVAPALSQLQRAALSVQLNITEGNALRSAPSFRRHLRIAYGSAVEVGEVLRLLSELGAKPEDQVAALMAENRRCQQLVLALLRSLSGK